MNYFLANGTKEPDTIAVEQRYDGLNDIFIRRNITEVKNEDESSSWEYEELQFISDKTYEEVSAEYDALWKQYDESKISTSEKIEDLENKIRELTELLANK